MNRPPRLFDRALLRARRRRAATIGTETFLLDRAAADLTDRLQTISRHFSLALDLGTPGDALVRTLIGTGQIDRFIACDALPDLRDPAIAARVAADEETLPFREQSFDLVVSALALHWVNDLPGIFAQVRRTLRPDGLFLAVLVGGESLTELRQALAAAEAELEGGAAPRVAPLAEVRALGSLLQRTGFALPVTDVDRLTARYSSLPALFNDLRRMGSTNALIERRRVPLRRATLARAAEIYTERFSDSDGKLRATYDLLSVSGWSPHADQPQPLRPGSARARLADALGTRERSAGEPATPVRGSGERDQGNTD